MIVFLLFIAVLLIGLTAAAVMGRIGGFMADPTSSQAFSGVPAGSLSSDDLAQVRFDRALRGYRMDEVDEVIDALGARLRDLEREVAPSPEEGTSSSEDVAPSSEEVAPPAEGAPSSEERAPSPEEVAPSPEQRAPSPQEVAPSPVAIDSRGESSDLQE